MSRILLDLLFDPITMKDINTIIESVNTHYYKSEDFMKTVPTFLKRNIQALFAIILIAIISITLIPCIVFGIEPVGTIGQPLPAQHAFLTDDTFVRVGPTHIQLVNTNTGEVVDEFGNLKGSSHVGFAPDGSHVSIIRYSGTQRKTNVEIWNPNTQDLISEWEFESDISYVGAFSPIAPLFATISDNEIYLWNWQTEEFVARMKGERRPFQNCYIRENGRTCGGSYPITSVFTPDGRYLIVASRRTAIELWNVKTHQLEGHLEGHIGNWVEGLVISQNGKRIATFDREPGIVYVWDMEAQQLLWKEQSGTGIITDLAFSLNNQHLYVATRTGAVSKFGTDGWVGFDDQIRIWDIELVQQIDMFGTEFRNLQSLTFSPNQKKALLYYSDAEVLWDIEEKRRLKVWADFITPDWYSDLALGPDGETFASVSSYFIKTWNIASQQLQLLVSAGDHMFRGFAISSDGQKLVVGRESDPWVELRGLQDGKIERLLPHSLSYVEKITYGKSGRWLAVSDDWDELSILDLKNPEKPQKLHTQLHFGHMLDISSFSFSENDVYFAATGRTGKNNSYTYRIMLWKREEDTFLLQYVWETQGYQPTFTTSADGSTVLASLGKGGVHIWELLLDEPRLITTLNGEGPMQFSPDGRYLIANQDGYLQIWDWQTSKPIKHASFPEFNGISQDGSVIVSYKTDGQFYIWDTKNLLSHLPYFVEPRDKKIVTLGQVKRNQLLQNFPNPFNPETWIPFRLASKSSVTIHIYSPIGKLVRSFSPGILSAGDYSSRSKAVHWDGRNDNGESVSSGVYLYTINAGNFSSTRKMLIRK